MGRGRSGAGGAGKPNDATEYYVSGDGMWINQYLRGRGDFGELTPNEKQFLKDLDTATDGKLSDSVLYRSVDARAIFGNLGDNDMDNLKKTIVWGDEAFGSGAYAESLREKAYNTIDKTIGKTITEKGFMSTTSDASIAEGFLDFTGSQDPVVLKIKTNGKARGVNLSAYDKNVMPGEEQKERLLARGQSFKVNNVRANKNRTIVIDVTLQ